MITGGDRDDVLLAAAGSSLAHGDPDQRLAGVILTGGIRPHESIFQLVRSAPFPVLLHEKDSYRVAAMVHNLVAKIQVEDKAKHETAKKMVRRHVDVDRLLEKL
jgi:BioD-like phosphotransacetylase family protein